MNTPVKYPKYIILEIPNVFDMLYNVLPDEVAREAIVDDCIDGVMTALVNKNLATSAMMDQSIRMKDRYGRAYSAQVGEAVARAVMEAGFAFYSELVRLGVYHLAGSHDYVYSCRFDTKTFTLMHWGKNNELR
jgi:hypothetical protein